MRKPFFLQFLMVVLIGGIGYSAFYGFVEYKIYSCKKLYAKVKNCPKIYAYDTLGWHVLNPALYVKSVEDEKSMIVVCDSEEARKNSIIDFPIQYMAMLEPVFLTGYSKDSLLVEVVDIDTKCWGFVSGYVYYKNIHTTPPSDSLIKKYNEHINGQIAKPGDRYIGLSPYGIQCSGH